MSLFGFVLLAAQATTAPLVTQAPTPASDQVAFDIRCMIVSQAASEKTEGPQKAAVALATMFYFGRVDSVLSGDALEKRIEAEGEKLEGKPIGPVMEQCGQFMMTHGKALQAIGDKLETREKAKQIR